MQLSLPWILSRKRLILALVTDWFLFGFLYYVLYDWRFGLWPSFSPGLSVLLVIWSLGSYVIGRYVSGAKSVSGSQPWDFIGRQLIGTAAVLLVTLGLISIHAWLFKVNAIPSSFQSFLIPFCGSLAVASTIVQLIIFRLSVIRDRDINSTWAYVGSDSAFKELQGMLKWSRVRVCVKHVPPDLLGKATYSQYIIDNFHDQPSDVLEILFRLQSQGSTVLSRLQWCELVLQRFPSGLLSDGDVLAGHFPVTKGTFQNRLKRLGDVVVAFSLLIVMSPLILISAILIKYSDGGPVFYSQIRTGLYGKPLRIWKLRTMRIDAEHHGAQWSSRSDPRITKVGSILRMTRLDELPQLWCVLIGSMSLIGPRPERPEFDKYLSQKISYYNLRHLIRPGLSGWAQVNYPYGASIDDAANKLSYDLFYLKNFSFLLDFLILFKTIRLVFNAQGSLPESADVSNSSL